LIWLQGRVLERRIGSEALKEDERILLREEGKL
jgi:hypothetical protein